MASPSASAVLSIELEVENVSMLKCKPKMEIMLNVILAC